MILLSRTCGNAKAKNILYEDVDKEMKLEELVKMACDLFGPPYDDREEDKLSRRSIREVGRIACAAFPCEGDSGDRTEG